jgi:N-glycosylase/DNA lyase
VANCICLFGYGRTGRAPVDVWIQRAIDEGCGGMNPFEQFGEDAGIIQQYLFFYQRNRKDSDESEPAGQTDHQVPA